MGGSREGSFLGVRVAAKARSWDPENGPSGALPLHVPEDILAQDSDGAPGTCGAVASHRMLASCGWRIRVTWGE